MLWPKQEVIALTLPQLAACGGKILSNNLVWAAIRQCARNQSADGKISFGNWSIVAKDILKWNDSCIQLFWDMLLAALWYSDDNTNGLSEYDALIDLAHLAIFLVLHVSDSQTKPSSPATAYNAVWPSNIDSDSAAASLMSSQAPMSPVKGLGAMAGLTVRIPPISTSVGSPLDRDRELRSPKSPHSPKSMSMSLSMSGLSPQGPGRSMHAVSPRHGKSASAAQALTSLRQRLPTILRAVALATEDESVTGLSPSPSLPLSATLGLPSPGPDTITHDAATHNYPSSSSSSSSFEIARPLQSAPGSEFTLSRRALNSLGLVIGGGRTREDQVSDLSSLHPRLSKSRSGSEGEGVSREPDTASDSDSDASTSFSTSAAGWGSVPYSELLEWIDASLCVNDLLYPNASSGQGAAGGGGGSGAGGIYSPVPSAPHSHPHSHSAANKRSSAFEDDSFIALSGGAGYPHSHSHSGGHSSSSSSGMFSPGGGGGGGGLSSGSVSGPSLVVASTASLSRTQPVVLSSCCSTYMHLVAAGPNRGRGRGGREGGDRDSAGLRDASKASRVRSRELSSGDDGSNDEGFASGEIEDIEEEQVLGEGDEVEQEQEPLEGDDDYYFEANSSAALEVPSASASVARRGGGKERSSGSLSSVMSVSDQDDNDDGDIEAEGEREMTKGARGKGSLGTSEPTSVHTATSATTSAASCRALPQLLLSSCHRAPLYLLGAYSSAFLTGCNDCDVVIGAVAGVVVVSGCERLRLSVACRKLVAHNCLECEFSVATLSPSIISGDTRSLVFGPINVAYRHFAFHLRLAGLHALTTSAATVGNASSSSGSSAVATSSPGEINSANSSSDTTGAGCNCWSLLCDVSACLEAPAPSSGTSSGSVSPKNYANDALTAQSQSQPHPQLQLPVPPPSTAAIMNPLKYKFVAVPIRSENQTPELCPVAIPEPYRAALFSRGSSLGTLISKIEDFAAAKARDREAASTSTSTSAADAETVGSSGASSGSSGSVSELTDRVVSSVNQRYVLANAPIIGRRAAGSAGNRAPLSSGSADSEDSSGGQALPHSLPQSREVQPSQIISAKFTEWLLATGKVHHLVDLVRIDAEKASGGRLTRNCNSSISSSSSDAASYSSQPQPQPPSQYQSHPSYQQILPIDSS